MTPCDGTGALEEIFGSGNDYGYATAEELRKFMNINGSVGFNVGMLLVMSFLPRYTAYWALRMNKERER
jgi:hypothetical protein